MHCQSTVHAWVQAACATNRETSAPALASDSATRRGASVRHASRRRPRRIGDCRSTPVSAEAIPVSAVAVPPVVEVCDSGSPGSSPRLEPALGVCAASLASESTASAVFAAIPSTASRCLSTAARRRQYCQNRLRTARRNVHHVGGASSCPRTSAIRP